MEEPIESFGFVVSVPCTRQHYRERCALNPAFFDALPFTLTLHREDGLKFSLLLGASLRYRRSPRPQVQVRIECAAPASYVRQPGFIRQMRDRVVLMLAALQPFGKG